MLFISSCSFLGDVAEFQTCFAQPGIHLQLLLSVARHHGASGWVCWRWLPSGFRIFLLTAFLPLLLRSASLLTLTFGLPSHTYTSTPLTRLIFWDGDSVSYKNAAKDKGHTGLRTS